MKMCRLAYAGAAVWLAGSLVWAQSPQERPSAAAASTPPAHPHVMLELDEVQWKTVTSSGTPLPPGQKQAILEGEPGTPGKPFTMLLWLPDGHRVPPHRHPVDENLTVLRGTWQMGAGEKYDETAMRELGAGAYVWMPAEQAHFGRSKGETIVQLHGIGPFKVQLVNPADPFAGAIYKPD